MVSDDALGLPASEGADYLACHTVQAELCDWPRQGQRVSDSLLEATRSLRASYLVAGAYGHSRFREAVLGGVTRELIRQCPPAARAGALGRDGIPSSANPWPDARGATEPARAALAPAGNRVLAANLREYADLLEQQQADSFRIAAEVLGGLNGRRRKYSPEAAARRLKRSPR